MTGLMQASRARFFLPSVTLIGIAMCGLGAVRTPTVMLALAVVALLFVLAFRWPQVGVSLWLVITCFVPAWTLISAAGINAGVSLVGVPILAGLVLSRRCRAPGWHWVDLVLIAGTLMTAIFFFTYAQQSFLATNVVFALALPYFLGRLGHEFLARALVPVLLVGALWGLTEFASGLHVFQTWQPAVSETGPAVQERAGLSRSEASFGHAIAFGATMAMAIPLAARSRFPVASQLLFTAAALVSLSRGPLIATAFAFALLVYGRGLGRSRSRSMVLLGGALVGLYLIMSFLYSGTGQSDVVTSSAQRDLQISRALGTLNLLGPADGTVFNAAGQYVTNGIAVIDSAPLRLSLDFGILVAAMLLWPLVYVAARAILTRSSVAPALAVCTQMPIILVTSFIMQWQSLLYLMAGMALSQLVQHRTDPLRSRRTALDPPRGKAPIPPSGLEPERGHAGGSSDLRPPRLPTATGTPHLPPGGST